MVELVKRATRRGLRRFGVGCASLRRNATRVRARILSELAIDLVLDVGANRGQYARELRAGGYGGRSLSFEPLPDAFAELAESLSPDPLWDGLPIALEDDDGRVEIHESANSVSSSILESRCPYRRIAHGRLRCLTFDGSGSPRFDRRRPATSWQEHRC